MELKSYRGWTIRRTNTHVLFGCGAVKVAKKDLLGLIEIVKDKKLTDAITLVRRVASATNTRYSMTDILQIEPATLTAIIGTTKKAAPKKVVKKKAAPKKKVARKR